MHRAVRQYLAGLKTAYPAFFKGAKILEVGSFNVNGTARAYFTDCDYLGVDVTPGRGVDLVLPKCPEGLPPGPYDCVISVECLEHADTWPAVLNAMRARLKPGGLMIVTCAARARPIHYTPPGAYYRNVSAGDFARAFDLDSFAAVSLATVRADNDLQFHGIAL